MPPARVLTGRPIRTTVRARVARGARKARRRPRGPDEDRVRPDRRDRTTRSVRSRAADAELVNAVAAARTSEAPYGFSRCAARAELGLADGNVVRPTRPFLDGAAVSTSPASPRPLALRWKRPLPQKRVSSWWRRRRVPRVTAPRYRPVRGPRRKGHERAASPRRLVADLRTPEPGCYPGDRIP